MKYHKNPILMTKAHSISSTGYITHIYHNKETFNHLRTTRPEQFGYGKYTLDKNLMD